MVKKIRFILFSALILLLCASCTHNESELTHKNTVSFGNIQNGGYIVAYENGYIYSDWKNDTLYKKDIRTNTVETIAKGHHYNNLNLYHNYIYYVDCNPGAIWKISIDGKKQKRLTWKRAGHLVVYDNHIYFRRSEDDDWGKLYRTDLNGRNAKLLAQCVTNFCIVNDRIYYTDIETDPKLCSMKTDGTDIVTINQSNLNNLFSMGDKLIYSDYNRDSKLFAYDLNTNTETCICQDCCENLNISEEWIFYRNRSDKGDLYRIRHDGSEREKLVDGNIVNVHVIGNRVFYKDVSNMYQLKYIDIE